MNIVNSIGIERDFGVFMPLLIEGSSLPASKEVTLITCNNDQEQVSVNILQGFRSKASENNLLGTLILPEIPKARRASVKIILKLNATSDFLQASLSESITGKCSRMEMPFLRGGRKKLTQEEKKEDALFVKEAEEFFIAHCLVEDTEILLNRIMTKVSHKFIDNMNLLISNLRETVVARNYPELKTILGELEEHSFEFGQYCSLYGNAEV